jgi:hypothetical protein
MNVDAKIPRDLIHNLLSDDDRPAGVNCDEQSMTEVRLRPINGQRAVNDAQRPRQAK